MSTPNNRNSKNYASPYSKPIQQYPSQSCDYFLQEARPASANTGTPHKQGRYYGTPRPKGNPNQPCTPSQSVDFLSLDMGSSSPHQRRQNWNRGTPMKFNTERNNSSNHHNYRGRQSGNRYYGDGNKHGRQQQWRHSYGSDKNNTRVYNPETEQSGNNDKLSLYYHPTMLEDPWRDFELLSEQRSSEDQTEESLEEEKPESKIESLEEEKHESENSDD